MCCRTFGKFLIGLALAYGASADGAEPGSPYLGWGDDGSGDVDAPFLHGHAERRWAGVAEALSLPDKSVVVTGNFRDENGSLKLGLVKLTPDGVIDPDFAYLGFSGNNDSTNWVTDALLDAQGHILTATFEGRLCRFNSVSGFPIAFEGGETSCVDIEAMTDFAGFRATGLVALGNGRVWVAGRVAEQGMWKYSVLLRLKANGSLDATFNGTGFRLIEPPPGHSSISFDGLRRATNGKLLAVGHVDSYDLVVMRFGPGGTVETWPNEESDVATFYGPDDFVLVDDPASAEDDIVMVNDGVIMKLDGETGLLVPDFGDEGSRTLEYDNLPLTPSKIRVASDGTLLIATVHTESAYPDEVFTTDGPFAIVRLLPNGSMDEAFGSGGVSALDYGGYEETTAESFNGIGLTVQNDAVIAARPAVHESPADTYKTVLIAKRHLLGDRVFADGFDP